MTEIISTQTQNKSLRKNLKIDMTPMVDLGFLLITFFIFTTSMAEPKAMNLIVPDDEGIRTRPTAPDKTLTLLLGKNNNVLAYKGTPEKAIKNNSIMKTGYHFSGAGGIIRQHQFLLGSQRDDLVVIIKPTKESSYKNLVDMLDEMQINGVKRYAIVNLTKEEAGFIAGQQ